MVLRCARFGRARAPVIWKRRCFKEPTNQIEFKHAFVVSGPLVALRTGFTLKLYKHEKTKTWSLWSTSSPFWRSILTVWYCPLMEALCNGPLDACLKKTFSDKTVNIKRLLIITSKLQPFPLVSIRYTQRFKVIFVIFLDFHSTKQGLPLVDSKRK